MVSENLDGLLKTLKNSKKKKMELNKLAKEVGSEKNIQDSNSPGLEFVPTQEKLEKLLDPDDNKNKKNIVKRNIKYYFLLICILKLTLGCLIQRKMIFTSSTRPTENFSFRTSPSSSRTRISVEKNFTWYIPFTKLSVKSPHNDTIHTVNP